MAVTGCDTTSVCCLRPPCGAIVLESWHADFSGSHMAQSSGESVSGRFPVSRQPQRHRVIVSLFVQRGSATSACHIKKC